MATEETRTEEFSAAAPPDPDASGSGETYVFYGKASGFTTIDVADEQK